MVVYTLGQRCEVGLRSTYRRCRFWKKKNIFSDKVNFDLRQAKLLHLAHAIFCRKWQGEAVTVNDDRYRDMLKKFLFTKLEEEDIGNIWFQQDGATCHTAEATLDVLSPVFEDRIISPRADVVWPAIWHIWTIICGVPSKISVTPTSQSKLTL